MSAANESHSPFYDCVCVCVCVCMCLGCIRVYVLVNPLCVCVCLCSSLYSHLELFIVLRWIFSWSISALLEHSIFSHIERCILNTPTHPCVVKIFRSLAELPLNIYCFGKMKNLLHLSHNMGMIFHSHACIFTCL